MKRKSVSFLARSGSLRASIDTANNAANFQQLFAWHAEGKVTPLVSQVFPLEQAAAAINALGQRKAVGKVVVQVR